MTDKSLVRGSHAVAELRRVVARIRDPRQSEQLSTVLANNSRTVERWIEGEHDPGGEALLRLVYIMSILGSQCIQHYVVPMHQQTCAEMIALDVVTTEEMSVHLDLGTAGKVSQHLLGFRALPLRCEPKVLEVLGRFEQEYHAAKSAFLEKHFFALSSLFITPPEPEVDHEKFMKAFALLHSSIEKLISDSYPSDKRRLLRDRIKNELGITALLDTSTNLNRLCSERARATHLTLVKDTQ
jgi:hypothetical protein